MNQKQRDANRATAYQLKIQVVMTNGLRDLFAKQSVAFNDEGVLALAECANGVLVEMTAPILYSIDIDNGRDILFTIQKQT